MRPWLTLRVSPMHLNRSKQREQRSIFSVSSVIPCSISGIPGIQHFALFFNQTHAQALLTSPLVITSRSLPSKQLFSANHSSQGALGYDPRGVTALLNGLGPPVVSGAPPSVRGKETRWELNGDCFEAARPRSCRAAAGRLLSLCRLRSKKARLAASCRVLAKNPEAAR